MSTERISSFDIEVAGRKMRIDLNDSLRRRLLDCFTAQLELAPGQADAGHEREELTRVINGLRLDSPAIFSPRFVMSGILSLAGFRVMSGVLNLADHRAIPMDWVSSWGEGGPAPLDDNDRMCDVFLNIKIEGRNMAIDLNNAICFRLIDFCRDEIRHALEDGDLDEHMEEMVQTMRGLKAEQPRLPHPGHVMAGVMSIAGFRFTSVDGAFGWEAPKAQPLIAHESA